MQEKSGASAQRLTPLTVSQVLGAVQQHKDDAFSVDGHELSQVSVVGTIKSVAKLSTNITLVIGDATGDVDVRQWLDSGDGGQQDYHQGMTIKVVGHVREFQEKRSILAFKIIVVTDPQEAVYHNLLATYVHLYHRFGPLPEGAEAAVGGRAGAVAAHGGGGISHSYQPPTAHAGHLGASNAGADIQRAVMQFVKGTTGNTGAAKSDIEKALKHMGSADAVDAAIEFLCQEGALYSTIDDSHYKSSLP